MNIITQKMKDDAKNYIKEQLSNAFGDLSYKIISFLFDNYSSTKNITVDINEEMKSLVLSVLKSSIEYLDLMFRNSEDRLLYYNVNKSKDLRSILTIFGELEIKRTYYEDKNREHHFYFIDNIFNFNKYDRYDPTIKALAIETALKTNQKKGGELCDAIINPFNNLLDYSISRQNIYNWIKDWNTPKVKYNLKESSDTLYVMIDEKFVHEQIRLYNNENDNAESKTSEQIKDEIINENKTDSQLDKYHSKKTGKIKNNIMVKAFIIFSSIKTINGKRVLQNKHLFLTASKNPWDEFINEIIEIYDFDKIKKIKVLSDAGKWITAGVYNLKLNSFVEVFKCLCDFHASQCINRSTHDKKIRSQLHKCIDHNNKQQLKETYEKLKENCNDKLKNEKLEKKLNNLDKYRNYLLNNWKSIINMKNSEYKSSMEAHISHNVADYFSSRPKAYSSKTIGKLLKLREYEQNGINIFNLYINSYNAKETITINQELLNYSIFEKNKTSNLPILENGKSNSLFHTLNHFAHANFNL
ncbi:MAG: UPF0236 family protein [Mycoplasmatota bacterium]